MGDSEDEELSLIPDGADDGSDKFHILAKPVFEVFRVSIHRREVKESTPIKCYKLMCLNDGLPCKIQGIIRVYDDMGNQYDLYNRKQNNLDIVNFGGCIMLTATPILPFKALKVVVQLYDKGHDVEIATGMFDLDFRTKYVYEKVHVENVEGEYGIAAFHYATFQHAVIATVEKVILSHVGGSDRRVDANLRGTVTAGFERTCGNLNSTNYPQFMLFDNREKEKEECESTLAQLNVPLQLFRRKVAVPVHSTLWIEANFRDSRSKIVQKVDMGIAKRWNTEQISGSNLEFRAEVSWSDGYSSEEFPNEIKLEGDTGSEEDSWDYWLGLKGTETPIDAEAPNLGVEESEMKGQQLAMSKLSSEAQQLSLRRQPSLATPQYYSFVEVFSVLVCCDDDTLDISGTIKVFDLAGSFTIFNGEEKGCEKTLSIIGPPRSLDLDYFEVRLDLKDGKGKRVSKGYFCWPCNNVSGLYDRHICSVIQGDVGYAAVHYSIFYHALQARVRIGFISETCPKPFINVCGRITAEYKNYEYVTPYSRKHYKSSLFERSEDDCVKVYLKRGSTLPLSKSVVSVPLEDSLILDINLKVAWPLMDDGVETNIDAVGDKKEFEVVEELVEFKANIRSSFRHKKSDYLMSVSVDWNDIAKA